MRTAGRVGWAVVTALAATLAVVPAGCGAGGSGSDGPEASQALPAFPDMPSHEVEEAAIGQSLESLAAALESGDTAAATALFTDEAGPEARAWLDAHPDLLAEMAGHMRAARTTSLSDEFGWRPTGSRRRTAEATVQVDGVTLYLGMQKVDGRWLVGTF